MDYIKQMNAFLSIREQQGLTPSETSVYLSLFKLNNDLAWREWFAVDNERLSYFAGVHRNSILAIKNKLKQLGFIDFRNGKGKSATQYKLMPLYSSSTDFVLNTVPNTVLNTVPNTVLNTVPNTVRINKLKLKTKTKTKTKTNISPNGDNTPLPPKGAVKRGTQKKPDPFAMVEDDALRRALMDYADMRKAIHKPLTTRGKELALQKLDELSEGNIFTQVKIVEQSILRSWQGLFPLKVEGGNVHPLQASNTQDVQSMRDGVYELLGIGGDTYDASQEGESYSGYSDDVYTAVSSY